MMKMVKTSTGYEFTADCGHLEVIETFPREGKTAILHNTVSTFKAKQLLRYFSEVKAKLGSEGFRYLVALSDHADQKMLKYWRLMGFEFFGKQDQFDYAVMEVGHGS